MGVKTIVPSSSKLQKRISRRLFLGPGNNRSQLTWISIRRRPQNEQQTRLVSQLPAHAATLDFTLSMVYNSHYGPALLKDHACRWFHRTGCPAFPPPISLQTRQLTETTTLEGVRSWPCATIVNGSVQTQPASDDRPYAFPRCNRSAMCTPPLPAAGPEEGVEREQAFLRR